MKHLELFAGIGGFRHALNLLGKDCGFPVECVGFSEIDTYASKTYQANYDTAGEIVMGDIVQFTSDETNIRALPDFDILTGGFPCQSFSMMGKQYGFKDVRGNVFFQIMDILRVKHPRFILLENVKNLKLHDRGNTFKVILASIKEAGYPYIYCDVFNTNNFGLAQTRNRVYIFASSVELPDNFRFDERSIKASFDKMSGETSLMMQESVLDILEKQVDSKYYLSDTLKPTILADGSKNFRSRSEINKLIARPLTATMVKMHRACQDNYFSEEFINSPDPVRYLDQTFSKEELARHHIRKLTPSEAFALQCFPRDFIHKAQQAGVSNHQLYKQAGNAVSVNTVYAILHYLFITQNLQQYVL